ncbi:MAG: tyrosine-type recombinase/integrase [Methanophagales archaeon]|nr:tyrosine-type recombinase/integrase [Methanophagales archaeon]
MGEIYSQKMKDKEEELLEKSPISEENKELISNFVNYKVAEKGITDNRTAKISRTLRLIAMRYLDGVSFNAITHPDIVRVVARIEQEGAMKPWTKRDYKLMLRMFLNWLGKDASWVKLKPPKNDLQAEDMLSVDEVNAMIDAAHTLRDKAFIATLYEGGFRISEIGTMRIKDVSFDEYGSVLIVRGKTGLRRVRLVSATPHLSQWLNAHPFRDNREEPLWISTNNETMRYEALRAQLIKIARRAKIQKRVNPQNFRHSCATFLAKNLTESQLEEYLGWVHGSQSPRTYVHLSGRDVDEKILQLHGLTNEVKREEPTVKLCPFCHSLNAISMSVCHNCKRPLEIKAVDMISLEDQVKNLREEIKKRDEDIEMLKQSIEGMKGIEVAIVKFLRGDAGKEIIIEQVKAWLKEEEKSKVARELTK